MSNLELTYKYYSWIISNFNLKFLTPSKIFLKAIKIKILKIFLKILNFNNTFKGVMFIKIIIL